MITKKGVYLRVLLCISCCQLLKQCLFAFSKLRINGIQRSTGYYGKVWISRERNNGCLHASLNACDICFDLFFIVLFFLLCMLHKALIRGKIVGILHVIEQRCGKCLIYMVNQD